MTRLARQRQERNSRFQQRLTAALREVAGKPNDLLLVELAECRAEAEALEQEEYAFLGQMGQFGAQQLPQAQESWRDTHIQILVARAQTCMLLGKLGPARAAVDDALRLIPEGGQHPARLILVTLQVQIADLES